MTFRFRLDSFKAKLVSLILAVTFITLLAASSWLAVVQVNHFQENLATSAMSNAAILSLNLVPVLLSNDGESARQLLSSMNTMAHVKEANVYKVDENGDLVLMGSYYKVDENGDLVLMGSYPEEVFSGDLEMLKRFISPVLRGAVYQITYPIQLDEHIIGYLYIRSEFSELSDFKWEMVRVISTIMTICLLMALVIALKFQAILLRPLSQMILITRRISDNKDFSLRLEESSNDEFRELAESFNYMLWVVQEQDRKQHAVEDEIRQLNQHLEHKVRTRTSALEASNKSLQSTLDQLHRSQKQLVEKEKMASLGGLVAGISHEINTPIGVSVTAVSHLGQLLTKLQERYETNKLSPKDLVTFMENAREGVDITSSNLFKAADLVKSFKQVAVDQSTDNIRQIQVKDYLHEILMSLRPHLKRFSHQVEVDCDENLVLFCNAGALSQIVTNFIMNSLIHAFEEIEQGHITISIKKTPKGILMIYADDGVGMPKESLERIFEPFFTTRRNQGGSGLGTHLIYNLVTQALHGTIAVSSKAEGGLRFEIEFPEGKPN